MHKLDELTNLERKIYFGEHLSEEELEDAVFELKRIALIQGEDRRWTRNVSSILQVADELFRIDWEQGLTECQEDEFNHQPYQVYKHEREVTKTEVWYDTHKE